MPYSPGELLFWAILIAIVLAITFSLDRKATSTVYTIAPTPDQLSRPIDLLADLPMPTSNRTVDDEVEYRLLQAWYEEGYLKSSRWQKKREILHNRAGHRCERCGASEDLHIHHLTYERLRYERSDDLKVLCKTCHTLAHDDDRDLRLDFGCIRLVLPPRQPSPRMSPRPEPRKDGAANTLGFVILIVALLALALLLATALRDELSGPLKKHSALGALRQKQLRYDRQSRVVEYLKVSRAAPRDTARHGMFDSINHWKTGSAGEESDGATRIGNSRCAPPKLRTVTRTSSLRSRCRTSSDPVCCRVL